MKKFLIAFALACFAALGAQAQTTLTGTFLPPSGQTPQAAGLSVTQQVSGTNVCGQLDFVPYNASAGRTWAILWNGNTYLPQSVRGYIRCSDGKLINASGALGVNVVPNVDAQPQGTLTWMSGGLSGSADGSIRATSWSEAKAVPDQSSVDWGTLPVASIVDVGIQTIESAGVPVTPLRTFLNFYGSGVSVADNPGSGRTDVLITAGGSVVDINGSVVANPNFNASSPSADANNLAATLKSSGSNVIVELPTFGASGSSHSMGLVPDPGATTGNSRYLNENGSFVQPNAANVLAPGTQGQLLFNNGGVVAAEDPVVSGHDPAGSAPTANPVLTAGSDGTDVRTVKTDSAGDVEVVFPSTPSVNVANATLNTADAANGSVSAGTVATKSELTGCQYNSTLPTLTSAQQAAEQCDSNGRQIVVIAGTPSVSISGTPTVTVGNASLAVTGTFWQSTQPVSVAATVNTSDLANGSVAAGAAATKSELTGCQFNTTPPTLTNTQQSAEQCDSSGRQIVVVAGTPSVSISGTPTVTVGNASILVTGTFWQATQPVSIAALVNTSDSGNGPVAAGTPATKSELIGCQFETALPTLSTGQQVASQCDSSGRMIVVLGGSPSVSISGTPSVSISGTPTVTVGNASLAVTGTFWQSTQPVSISATVNTSDLANGSVGAGTAASKSELIGCQFNSSLPTLVAAQQSATQCDSSGRLLVDIAGTPSVSISGTPAVSISGTPTVTVGNASLAVTGTFWQSTQPVSVAATLSTTDAANGPVAAGTPATKSELNGCQYESTPPTLTTGQQVAEQCDSSGRQIVVLGGASTVSISGTVTVAGTGNFNAVGTQASNSAVGNGLEVLPGRYDAALPTLTSGNAALAELDSNGRLLVNCSVGCGGGGGGGSSITDEGAFTAGSTSITPIGGVYSTGSINLVSGQSGAVRLTTDRRMMVDLEDVGGSALALGQTTMSASVPVVIASNQSSLNVTATASGNFNNASVGSNLSAAPSSDTLAAAVYNTVLPTPANGQIVALQADAFGRLIIDCASGCGGSGGTSVADESAFTQGSTNGTPIFGLYSTSVTNLVNGQTGAMRVNNDRTLMTDLTEVGGLALSLGQTAMSSSVPVVIASNQSNINVAVASALPSGTNTIGKVDVLGNSGGSLDAGQNAAAPSNEILVGGVYNSSAPSLTSGNASQLQLDSSGNLKVDLAANGFGNVTVTGTVTANEGGAPWTTTDSSDMSGTTPGTAPSKTGVVGGIYNTSAPTPTNGQTLPFQVDASGRLIVDCGTGCSGSGTQADEASFTQGTTAFMPIGGYYNPSPANLTSGQGGALRLTTDRNLMVDLNEVGGIAFGVGQNTSANSLSIVLASDYSTPDVLGSSGALGALNNAISVATNNNQSVGFEIPSGTLIGTLVPEVSYDGGTSWYSTNFLNSATGAVTSSLVFGSANTATSLTIMLPGGASNARVRVSVYTSGTVTGQLRATLNTVEEAYLVGVGIKPAFTSPSTSDASLTTAISPNNTGLPVNLAKLVQKNSASSTGSVASINAAFSSNTTQGNTIVVEFCNGNTNVPTAPISDTQVNTFYLAAHVVNGSAFECDIWYTVNVLGAADTITVTPGGTNASIAMEIYEVQGLMAVSQAPNQPDAKATNSSTTNTASPSVTVSPALPNEYSFAAFGLGTAAQTITVTAPYKSDSGQLNPTTPAGLFSMVASSNFLGALAPSSPAASVGTGEPWAVAVATFKPVAVSVAGSVAVTPTASSANATTTFRAAAVTSATTVKSTPGNLYGWYIYNPNASACSLEVFNTTSPTLGTTTPILSLMIPASSGANIPPSTFAVGNFSTAMSVASVTAAGGGTTCSTGMVVNLWYQ